MTNPSEAEAYDLGYDAYWEGVDESDNPFEEEEEPEQRRLWDEGWCKARADDYDESD
jgi:ribosome modulation factor